MTDWRAERIEELFTGFPDDRPGVAAGVAVGGSLAFERCRGLASLELGVPLGPDSVLDIASVSKQFTAGVVLAMADDGILGLEDRLVDHVPALPEAVYGDILVRHLIHHTSGVADYLALMALSGRRPDNTYAEDELVDLIARQPCLDAPPGTRFSYSDSGYFLLSQVVRAAGGRSLRVEAAERLFEPAGMTATRFRDDHTEVIPGLAAAYSPRLGSAGLRLDVPILDILGDGAVFSTLRDLAAWTGQFSAPTLRGGADFMTRLTTPGALDDGTPLDYAFGLRVDERRPRRRIWHRGSWGGYRTAFTCLPDLGTGLIVLANLATIPADRLALAMEAIVSPRSSLPAPPAQVETPAIAVTGDAPAELAGHYRDHVLDAGCELSVVADRPRLRFGWTDPVDLAPIGVDRFALLGELSGRIEVEREAGRPVALTVVLAEAPPRRFART